MEAVTANHPTCRAIKKQASSRNSRRCLPPFNLAHAEAATASLRTQSRFRIDIFRCAQGFSFVFASKWPKASALSLPVAQGLRPKSLLLQVSQAFRLGLSSPAKNRGFSPWGMSSCVASPRLESAFVKRHSLRPQRRHRIDSRSSARRNKSRNRSRHQQHHNRDRQTHRIIGTHPIKLIGHVARSQNRNRNPNR